MTFGLGGGGDSESESKRGWTSYEINAERAHVVTDKAIKSRELKKSGCSRKLEIRDEDGNTCPLRVGFDVWVTPEVGVSLYVLLNAYLQVK